MVFGGEGRRGGGRGKGGGGNKEARNPVGHTDKESGGKTNKINST